MFCFSVLILHESEVFEITRFVLFSFKHMYVCEEKDGPWQEGVVKGTIF